MKIANEALAKGNFPEKMKEARLTLIPKIGKSTDDAKGYRPISLLGVFRKMLEARLKEEIRSKGDLHERQHGFQTGRSTIGVTKEVMDIVRQATNKAAQHKELCVLVTINVRNAFNVTR